MATAATSPAYDVFLCHNSKDKDAVRTINEILRQEFGLSTYLDEAAIVGGDLWEQGIQSALAAARACLVIVGPHGWGKYQLEQEARPAVVRRGVDSSFRVIPVLLPGAEVAALSDFADFFSPTHWINFEERIDDTLTIRTLAFAIRGENAFPEGRPRLTASRVCFDATRWDVGSRRDDNLLYTGHLLQEARRIIDAAAMPLAAEFLRAGLRNNNERIARQLAAHANVMWSNPRRRDLAARLALESADRRPTAEAMAVLRQAYSLLPTAVGTLNHPAAVSAAMLDASKRRLATGCADGSVCVWDGETLRLVGKHTQIVRAIADLGNGRFVTGSADGVAIVWDWASGKRTAAFKAGDTIEAFDVHRSGDRTLLLTSGGIPGNPGDVDLRNAETGDEIWRMGMVTEARFDRTGAWVVLAWGNHVALRAVADGALGQRQEMSSGVTGVAAHPSMAWVAATTFDRTAQLVSFESDPPRVQPLGNGTSRVSPIRISPDGRYAAALRDDFHAAIWDLRENSRQLIKYEGLVGVDIRFSDRGRYLAVISPEAKAITVWRTDDGQHVCTIEQNAAAVALFDDVHNQLWAASEGPTVSCIAMPRQSESFSTAAPGVTTAMTFAPDGTLAWSGMPVGEDLRMKVGDFGLWVLDPLTGTTRIDVKLPEVCRLAFDADSSRIAAIGEKTVQVWSVETGEEAPLPSTPFWPLGKEDDARTAAALELPEIEKECRQRGCVKAITGGDGKMLAIDHGQQLVTIWNARSGTRIAAFSTVAAVDCMVFSLDGALFAAGDVRGGVMLCQSDGTLIGQMQHDEPISHLAFSPDRKFLAVASRDSVLRLWIASPAVLAEAVRAKVSAPLSDEEWSRYLGDEPRAIE